MVRPQMAMQLLALTAHRAWVPRDKLHKLGEGTELDELMCSKGQLRDARKRQQVRAALKAALADVDAKEE